MVVRVIYVHNESPKKQHQHPPPYTSCDEADQENTKITEAMATLQLAQKARTMHYPNKVAALYRAMAK